MDHSSHAAESSLKSSLRNPRNGGFLRFSTQARLAQAENCLAFFLGNSGRGGAGLLGARVCSSFLFLRELRELSELHVMFQKLGKHTSSALSTYMRAFGGNLHRGACTARLLGLPGDFRGIIAHPDH